MGLDGLFDHWTWSLLHSLLLSTCLVWKGTLRLLLESIVIHLCFGEGILLVGIPGSFPFGVNSCLCGRLCLVPSLQCYWDILAFIVVFMHSVLKGISCCLCTFPLLCQWCVCIVFCQKGLSWLGMKGGMTTSIVSDWLTLVVLTDVCLCTGCLTAGKCLRLADSLYVSEYVSLFSFLRTFELWIRIDSCIWILLCNSSYLYFF
jgi:hypothetical protein